MKIRENQSRGSLVMIKHTNKHTPDKQRLLLYILTRLGTHSFARKLLKELIL